MVNVSQAFRTALNNGAEQHVLIRFEDDTTFTEGDISASTGLQFTEMINPDVDLTIGATPSSTLRFSILNDDDALSDFAFGAFTAAIGVEINRQTYSGTGMVSLKLKDGTTVAGYAGSNYLHVGASKYNVGFPVKSIIAVDGMIYAFGDGGKWFGYPSTWETVSNYTWGELANWRWMDIAQVDADGNPKTLNKWMRGKVSQWVDRGLAIRLDAHMMYDYTGGASVKTVEYVPLGTFIGDRPTVVSSGVVTVDALDQMVRFDEVLEDMTVPLGATIADIFVQLCDYFGVQPKHTVFPNSTRKIDYTINLQDVTGRELLSSIAEAAGGYARFDRDGLLEIAWFSDNTSMVYDESDYTFMRPVDYLVPPIDRVRLANTNADFGAIVGTGKTTYNVTDNPLLDIKTQTVGEGVATAILNRLKTLPAYHPGEVALFAGWSLQAGDIITVKRGDVEYTMPIFTVRLQWAGSTLVTLSNSGNRVRPPVSARNRQSYRTSRRIYELNLGIEGLQSKVTEVDNRLIEVDNRLSEVREEFASDITQTAQSIRLEVTAVRESLTELGNTTSSELSEIREDYRSEITQTAQSITQEVSAVQSAVNGLNNTVSQQSSRIDQLADQISLAVTSENLVTQLNLSKEGVKIKGALIDITGTVSLNGDTKVDANGTLTTKNMTATAATITGTFSAPYTRLGQVVWDGEAHQGIFFSSSATFSASKIVGAFARDSYGEYHLTATGGALYIDTELSEPVLMNGSEIFMSAHASDETLVIGRDPGQSAYTDLCVYPESSTYENPRGNCGTPAHPWDTCTADQFFSDNGIKGRSSRELKKDIEALPDMGEIVDTLRPVSFRYKSDSRNRLHYGLIFEETEDVAPILCDRSGDRPEDCRIGYGEINLILLREMQEVRKRLAILERGASV